MQNDTVPMGWFIAVCVALAVCLIGWVGSGSRVSDLTNAAEEREQVVQELRGDANLKYNDLFAAAKDAKDSVTEQCEWLLDNISDGVAEYCQGAADKFDENSFEESPFGEGYEEYEYSINSAQID